MTVTDKCKSSCWTHCRSDTPPPLPVTRTHCRLIKS